MIKTTILSVLLSINTMGMYTPTIEELGRELIEEQEIQEARDNGIEILQPIEIFFMYGNENGTYWIDPAAEYENVIFVDYESLKEWDIDYNSLHHGKKMIGLFDEIYSWELLGMITEEEEAMYIIE